MLRISQQQDKNMSSRGNDGLVNTDNTDEILQTNLHTPERLRLQHGNNLPRTLTNRHEKILLLR